MLHSFGAGHRERPKTPANKSLIGEITAADSATKTLTVKGDDGSTYTVTLSDTTSYLRLPLGEKDLKKAEKIGLSDVSVGDRLLARGPLPDGSKTLPARTVVIMTKADIAKKRARMGRLAAARNRGDHRFPQRRFQRNHH